MPADSGPPVPPPDRDPLHRHHVSALQRRAATLSGSARALVEARIAQLQADGDHARPKAARASRPSCDTTSLSSLLQQLEVRAAAPNATGAPAMDAIDAQAVATASTQTARLDNVAPRAIDAVADLRRLWGEVRTRSQVRQSLQQAPTHAGPLNSASLVHRALGLMRDTSPGYLRHFMAYLDALSCLEGIGGSDPPPTTGLSPRRPAPRKPRARETRRRGRPPAP